MDYIEDIGTDNIVASLDADTIIPANDPSEELNFSLVSALISGQTYSMTIHLSSGNIIQHTFQA